MNLFIKDGDQSCQLKFLCMWSLKELLLTFITKKRRKKLNVLVFIQTLNYILNTSGAHRLEKVHTLGFSYTSCKCTAKHTISLLDIDRGIRICHLYFSCAGNYMQSAIFSPLHSKGNTKEANYLWGSQWAKKKELVTPPKFI